MRVLDLFSGIGGFSLGLERAGMQTVAFCEADAKARLVIKKHWPAIPIYEDVRTLTHDQLERDGIGPIDLVCGGFPCQPFSHAGKRMGAADDRDLWPEMFRVIKDVRPGWVLAENVTGLANMGQPIGPAQVESKTLDRLADCDYYRKVFTQEEIMYLSAIVEDLESAGYRLPETTDGTPIIPVIPAVAVGAHHRRDRVWIVAHSQQTRAGDKFGSAGVQGRESSEAGAKIVRQGNGEACSGGLASTGEDVPNTTGERRGETRPGVERSTERSAGRGAVCDSEIATERAGFCAGRAGGKRRRRSGDTSGEIVPHSAGRGVEGGRSVGEQIPQSPAGERLSGCNDSGDGGCHWPVEPDVGRVAHGVPKRVDRLKQLGNAVVPKVVETIGRAIMEVK